MIVLVALLLAAPNPDRQAAEEAFLRGDYEAALEHVVKAYEVEPDPSLLFARGSTLEKLERYEDAIETYEAFLASDPDLDRAQKARDRIEACREMLQERAPTKPVEPPPPTTQVVPEPPPPTDTGPAPARAWYGDPLGGALAGSGLALGIAGGVMVALGAQRRQNSDGATEGEFRSELRSSNALQGVGIGLAASGALVMTGAILRYVKVSRASSSGSGLAIRF